MNKQIPLLVELGKTALVGTSLRASLMGSQADAQDELRERMPRNKGAGLIYPWGEEVERRDMTATGGVNLAQGGYAIGTEVLPLGTALRANLVLERLGARIFGGLTGNVRFPLANAGISTDWKSENADAPDGSFTFRGLNLAPHRVTAYLDVSTQLLLQGESIEVFLRQELMAALAEEIQRATINGSGANDEPLGILNTPAIGSVVGGPDGAAPDYDDITQLEFLVANANADRGRAGFICSPQVRRKLRRTAMFASGSQPIWPREDARALLGHPAGVTRSSPDTLTKGTSAGVASAILHGDFSELFAGFWGPGILVEAVAAGGHVQGKVRFLATAYYDSGVRASEAFAAMKDALCAT